MSEESGPAEIFDLLDRQLLQTVEVSEPTAAHLKSRYIIQICGDEDEEWKPFDSCDDPMDAVRACSEFVNALKTVVGIDELDDLAVFTQILRVIDANTGELIVWGEDGALRFEPKVFEQDRHPGRMGHLANL